MGVVGGGGCGRVVSVGIEYEIGRLALHLDRLLDTLEARSRELRELNAELDQKVVGRTRELAQANEELKAAQQKLVRSEKLAAIGQLTAGVAHEIGNSVTGTDFLAQNLLPESRDANPPAAPRHIIAQTQRISTLVHALVGFAHSAAYATPAAGEVPGLERPRQVATEGARRHEGQVEGGRAEATDAGHPLADLVKFLQEGGVLAVAQERDAGGEHAFGQVLAGGLNRMFVP